MRPPQRRSAVLAVWIALALCACDTTRVPASGSPAMPTATATTTAISSTGAPSTPATPPTAAPDATAQPTPGPTPSATESIEHCTGEPSPELGGATFQRDSTWAGYVAARPPGRFTCVEASWLEPAVTCGASETVVHVWIGIGGYTSADLGIADNIHPIQMVGTGVECKDGAADHYAWHQVAPRESEDQAFEPGPDGRDLVVEPGDHVWAQIRFSDGGFVMTVANLSSGELRSTTERGGGRYRSSAEWVVSGERGEPIARFGSVTFVDGLCTMDGVVGPIGSKAWRRNWVDEWSNATRRLSASALSDDGGSFEVTWHHR